MPQGGLRRVPAAIFFDLDGTLIDSAPDLAGACNDMRVERGLEPLPYDALRRMVGSGARGMVGAGFGLTPGEPGYETLREEFLLRYEGRMTRATQAFPQVPALLAALVRAGKPWGIVTNKAERYAVPLVAALGLDRDAACLIGGDTTAHAKPHPEPLLEAARRVGVEPETCAYVGDDRRDVEAGRAAGMETIVAAWGYLGDVDTPPSTWGADAIVSDPEALAVHLLAPGTVARA